MTEANEDELLRSVVLQNAERIRVARLRAEQHAEATLREQAQLLNLTHDAIVVLDMVGTIKYWNRGAQELYGWPAEQAIGNVIEVLLKTVFPVPLEMIEEEVTRTGRWEGELVHTKSDGSQVVVASRWSLQRDERSAPLAIMEINNDITQRKRDAEVRKQAEALLAGEKRILELVAKGNPLPEILESLCRLVEEQASGALASILLVEGDRLRHGGAPSLPKAYADAIDRAVIGPREGSCGTAAYFGKQVIVEDIATDPLWAKYRDVALPHSLLACWSTPVFSSQGKVIATFAMYYREPRRPSRRDQEIIEQITDLAGVAIERKLTYDRLQRSESYLAGAQTLSQTGSFGWNTATGEIYWTAETFRIYEFDRANPPDIARIVQQTHPDDRALVEQTFDRARREKTDFDLEHRLLMPDGSVKHLQVVARASADESGDVEFVGAVMDVTQRKRAEEAQRVQEREREAMQQQLQQAAKMEALGRLAGGIAHDFNNLLGSILGYGELVQDGLKCACRGNSMRPIRRSWATRLSCTRSP
jgi:PAS domain S-box-containing protein